MRILCLALFFAAMIAGPSWAGDSVAASVPARTIKSGEIIAAGDLREGSVPARQLRPDSLVSEDHLLGMQARRTLVAGRVISASSVGDPYLVERNQRVAALYRDGTLSLRMSAVCMDNGTEGESVRVTNLSSGQVLHATVTGTGEVRIEK